MVPVAPGGSEGTRVPPVAGVRGRGTRVAPVPGEEIDYAGIAAKVREQETVDDGIACLEGLKLRGKKPLKSDLIAIAKELGLTLPASVTLADAKRKLLHHAIGNRRKYDGLRP
ncbi:hypothetical protein AFR_30195 [Actinoplanes friuliensis DSM 7358]|uniref:Uncharacterized protein n=1 Tax=Actinoplanes friuliensis DSM 7358 TaxID=1246995 RepID=U5W575_9ACTN|nr:hypothetical protein AFR_30195 [Actinoplanes friuliensis DSM 7358]